MSIKQNPLSTRTRRPSRVTTASGAAAGAIRRGAHNAVLDLEAAVDAGGKMANHKRVAPLLVDLEEVLRKARELRDVASDVEKGRSQ